MHVYVDPTGERCISHLLAYLDTHYSRLSVKFSSDRLASCQVKRRTVELIAEYFEARVSVAAPEVRDCH